MLSDILKTLYYVPYCSVCGEAVTPPLPSPLICRSCLASMPFRMDREPVLWEEPWPCFAVFFYCPPVDRMLVSVKFSGRMDRAEAIGALMAVTAKRRIRTADVLIPVPLHPKRLAERGFNQAACLAVAMGKRLNITVDESILFRRIHTFRQSEAPSAAARRHQFREAFDVDVRSPLLASLRGRPVILVDDILTTGATLAAAARVLSRAGLRVTCLAAAAGQGRYLRYGEALRFWHRCHDSRRRTGGRRNPW